MTSSNVETTAAGPRLNYASAAPATLQAMLTLQQAANRTGLEPALLELVKLRVSQINGCAFCIHMHFRDAVKAGETPARLYLLDAWAETELYSARERAALRWAEALTRLAGGRVTDEDFAAAKAEFSESELALLTLAIVAINGWNRFNVGFRTPPALDES
jgi:AhpD family alkylhydroperoxidase